jgi:hypothetical protein
MSPQSAIPPGATFPTIDPATIVSLLSGAINSIGQPLTMSRGGVNTTYHCVIDHANAEIVATYFDANTAAGLTHPVAIVFLDGSCSGTNNPPQNLDSFSYAGRTYSCAMNAAPFNFGGDVILYAVCAD